MSKSYLVTFAKDYSIVVNTELSYLLDQSPSPFFEATKDGKKYFINRNNILFFKEYDKQTDAPISKQF